MVPIVTEVSVASAKLNTHTQREKNKHNKNIFKFCCVWLPIRVGFSIQRTHMIHLPHINVGEHQLMIGGIDNSGPIRTREHITCAQRTERTQHCRLCTQCHLLPITQHARLFIQCEIVHGTVTEGAQQIIVTLETCHQHWSGHDFCKFVYSGQSVCWLFCVDLPPPRFSFVASVRSGKRKILAEMSVHSPTATKSDVVAPSPSGLMSKQAISTSSTVCLQKKF